MITGSPDGRRGRVVEFRGTVGSSVVERKCTNSMIMCRDRARHVSSHAAEHGKAGSAYLPNGVLWAEI